MKKRSLKMMVTILILQILVMAIVYIFVDSSITANIKNTTIKSMETIAQERSEMIENYIRETENYLTAYSRSSDVTDLLKNPGDPVITAKAQKYTEQFSADRAYLEGIYASEWDTHVLAHTNAKVVGIYTRKGDSLQAIQKSMSETDGVYNAGIVLSPASNEQIISIYRACYDESHNPIGFVGGGVFTEGIIGTLDNLPSEGMEQLQYYLVNVKTGEYIFHADKEKVNTVAEETYVQDIIQNLGTAGADDFGYLVYEDENLKEKYMASYDYMEDRGWVFIINDPYKEVFSSLKSVRKLLLGICFAGVLLLTFVTYRIVNYLMNSLQKTVDTLELCCDSINEKTSELYSHSDDLVDNVTDNTATIDELSASLNSTDRFMESVKAKVEEINHWMQMFVVDMKRSVRSSEDLIEKSEKMAEQSQNAYEDSYSTFEETKNVVMETMKRMEGISEINKMADGILDIAKQTTLLSFNVTLEAVRAGTAGKGFTVVAREIGELAHTTTETASAISQMCDEINESVEQVRDCFDMVIRFMEQTVMNRFYSFTESAYAYSDSVSDIQQDISKLEQSTDSLKASLSEISENIYAVKEITHENGTAIGMISDKNMDTYKIAGRIQEQSDSNKELITNLEKIIEDFKS